MSSKDALQSFLYILLLGCIVGAPISAQDSSKYFNFNHLEQFLPLADRVPMSISADGKFVSYTLQVSKAHLELNDAHAYFSSNGVPRSMRGTSVYLMDLEEKEASPIAVEGNSWGGSWSPDGKLLAFYSDKDGFPKVWLWNRETEQLEKLVDDVVRPFWGFEQILWSKDGSRILVKLLPKNKSLEEMNKLVPDMNREMNSSGQTIKKYTANLEEPVSEKDERKTHQVLSTVDFDETNNYLNVQFAELAWIDLKSRKVNRITEMERIISYRFSQNGQSVVYTTRQPDDGTGKFTYRLYDVWYNDLKGKSELIASRVQQGYGQSISFSPNGEMIAYGDNGAIVVQNLKSNYEEIVFRADGASLTRDYEAPLWLDDATLFTLRGGVIWKANLTTKVVERFVDLGNNRLFKTNSASCDQLIWSDEIVAAGLDSETKKVSLNAINLRSGKTNLLTNMDLSTFTNRATHLLLSNNKVVFEAQSGNHPMGLWSYDLTMNKAQPLASFGEFSDRPLLGKSKLIRWKTNSGKDLKGALLLPADYQPGKKYPLIVKVYGGSLSSSSVYQFGLDKGVDNLQFFASRGYAVLRPDAPLTSNGNPMSEIAEIVESGAEAVIALGIADSKRIAVLGHSYGGYSSLSAAVSSNIYSAVISSAGFSNLFSRYATMRNDGSMPSIFWSEKGQGRMNGTPWNKEEKYLENSPFFRLNEVSAPVLLLHGGADITVSPERAKETFTALSRLGKKAKLVVYEGEDHHPGSWKSENARDYIAQILFWLAQYVPANHQLN